VTRSDAFAAATSAASGYFRSAPRGTSFGVDRFRSVVDRFADSTAVGNLEREITYEELARTVDRLVARLRTEVAPGPIIIAVDEPIDLAAGILAALQSGRVCHLVDHRLSVTAEAELLAQLSACVMFKGLPLDDDTDPFSLLREPGAGPTTGGLDPGPARSDAVILLNTSGSTGNPKLVTEHAVLPFGRDLPDLNASREQEHVATNLSMTGVTYTRCLRALLVGDRFTGFHLNRYPPRRLVASLVASAPTQLACTPTVLRHLGAMVGQTESALASVRSIAVAGESLRWSDVAVARRMCGPDVVVENVYGSTETGRIAARVIDPHEPLGDGPVPVGRSPAGRTIWIAKPDGSPAPAGMVGGIVIDGVFTTSGISLEELGDGRSRFRSADLGHLDLSGTLWLEGRSDRVVKVAGMRVDPAVAEEALLRFPGVLGAAVVAAEMENSTRLVAHLIVAQDLTLDLTGVRSAVTGRLPPVLVPARFFARSEPFPMLPSGKTDYRTLQRQTMELLTRLE